MGQSFEHACIIGMALFENRARQLGGAWACFLSPHTRGYFLEAYIPLPSERLSPLRVACKCIQATRCFLPLEADVRQVLSHL